MGSIIRNLPFEVFLAMLAVPLAMAGIAVAAGVHARRRAALVSTTPASLVSMADDGYREFEGTVEAIGQQTLRAPLTGAACCWYHARVERWAPQRGTSATSRWETVRDVTSSAPFFVRDASGVCTVRPLGAEVTPRDRSVWTGAGQEPDDRNPPRLAPTESPGGMVQISGGPTAAYRYSEERIYPGDPLVVVGAFTSGRFAATGEDDDAGDDEAADDAVQADAIGNGGELDADDPLVVDDRLTALAATVTRASIGKGAGRKPFLLAATSRSQHADLAALGGSAALGIAVVPLAIAALMLWLRVS